MHPGSLARTGHGSRRAQRTSIAAAALATTVAVVLPVAADAPISGAAQQYDNFGPNDVTIRDRKSELRWSRPRPGTDYPIRTLTEAKTFCAGLTPANTYRLPTLKELLSLVDEEPHPEYVETRNQARFIDKRAFSGTPEDHFWTSSQPQDGNGTYTVDFQRGLVTKVTGSADARAVRCVR